MLIGQRLRKIRVARNLSQADIAQATGFAKPYISRVENGYTVPNVETLNKWANARKPPISLNLPIYGKAPLYGSSGREVQELGVLRDSLEKMSERDRKILLALARCTTYRSRMR